MNEPKTASAAPEQQRPDPPVADKAKRPGCTCDCGGCPCGDKAGKAEQPGGAQPKQGDSDAG